MSKEYGLKENDKKERRFEDFSFEFFGVRWEVRFVDEIIAYDGSPRGVTDGTAEHDFNVITIATKNRSWTDYGADHVRRVLLHELLHIMTAEGQYGGEHNSEPFIEWMAHALDELIDSGAIDRVKALK